MRRLAAVLLFAIAVILAAWLAWDPGRPARPPAAVAAPAAHEEEPAAPPAAAPRAPRALPPPALREPFVRPADSPPAPSPQLLAGVALRAAPAALDDEPRFAASPDGIREAVEFKKPELHECYDDWLKLEPGLQGRLAVRFAIEDAGGGAGAAREVELASSDLQHTALEGCVVSVFESMRFEAPAGGRLAVTYPVTFSPGDAGPAPAAGRVAPPRPEARVGLVPPRAR